MNIDKSKIKVDKVSTNLIRKAADFHGHLGPFLVIGVRMGNLARKRLNVEAGEDSELQATARLPFLTPFSCILDGIQITTHCTVGNRKLKIENSQETITLYFERHNPPKELKIHVDPKVVEELEDGFSKGTSNEELAHEIASISEDRLFIIEKE